MRPPWSPSSRPVASDRAGSRPRWCGFRRGGQWGGVIGWFAIGPRGPCTTGGRLRQVRQCIDRSHLIAHVGRGQPADTVAGAGHVGLREMLFPPAADPRLKEEIFSLLRLAKKLEMNAIDHTPRSDYRARIGEKLGIEIPD